MHQPLAGATAIKASNTVTQAGAVTAIYFGFTLNELGIIVGMLIGILGLILQVGLTWYYKHKHYLLAKERHTESNDE